MAFDKDAFLTSLDSMSVMELNDLVKAIEEKFGVSAAAMAAPAAAGGGAGAAAAVEEKTEFNVVLTEAGANTRGGWGRHRCGAHAEFLFDCLDQVIEFHDGHAVQGGQECVFIECHVDFLKISG